MEEEDSNVDRFRDVSFKKEVQMILKCNRVGLENDDIGQNISKYGAEYNANEFEKIYQEEKKKTDENITEDAFTRSIKRYLKKPILISIFCYSIGILLLFMVKVIKINTKLTFMEMYLFYESSILLNYQGTIFIFSVIFVLSTAFVAGTGYFLDRCWIQRIYFGTHFVSFLSWKWYTSKYWKGFRSIEFHEVSYTKLKKFLHSNYSFCFIILNCICK